MLSKTDKSERKHFTGIPNLFEFVHKYLTTSIWKKGFYLQLYEEPLPLEFSLNAIFFKASLVIFLPKFWANKFQ